MSAAVQIKQTRCGYCHGPLADAGDRFECPRCVPLLATIAEERRAGLSFDEWQRAWVRFEREAVKARGRVGGLLLTVEYPERAA